MLASAADDTTVRLWDVRARRQLGEPLEGQCHTVDERGFTPDGRTVASGAMTRRCGSGTWPSRRSRSVLVTDTDEPAEPQATGRVAGVLGVAFSPRGGILASADEERCGPTLGCRPRASAQPEAPAAAGLGSRRHVHAPTTRSSPPEPTACCGCGTPAASGHSDGHWPARARPWPWPRARTGGCSPSPAPAAS